MKIKICIFIMMGFVLSIYGKADPYDQEPEQKAVRLAYDILKVYYPSNELCVSDSIYDLDWDAYSKDVNDSIRQEVKNYRINRDFVWDDPIYSRELSELFETDTCRCNKYEVDFSAPYKHMILCEIMPKDRKIGIQGVPRISSFLFKYDEDGEVYFVRKYIIHID